ncbi:CoA transferase [Thalassococcus sp. S3]|uniref:CoA transferase n=1 Tax=Thalassococcus sp. S3 TaxID=2017482 RepID=UPI001023F5D0|nr:CoA transferase [Thalassococcus sp. S3]QBF33212.1 acyl-CoA transferase [Thalassococcus sp. S3]
MQNALHRQIDEALGLDLTPPVSVTQVGSAELPSCFAVTDLAVSAFRAASVELAELIGAHEVVLDRRLAALWFDMTLRPVGWDLPSAWDAIAGVYRSSDGWIRLHTNAPHHRDAALRVLDCAADWDAVASVVERWRKTDLEAAIVAGHGAAAAMHTTDEWAAHPQGRAVASEPLIDWQQIGAEARPVRIEQIKVLDLTRVLAGPVATRFLAGFGAEVLRIDPPWWTEPGVEPEVTLGKRRAGLDLTQTNDRTRFERLLSDADVLVHGYRPGALEGLGYGRDRLCRLAPHLIDVSLCAYGWSGPWADRRGFDSLVQMSCGIAEEGMRRKGADRPVPLPVQALDHATGYLMAATVLRALRIRNRSGKLMSARLSLARTAALLTSQGSRDFQGAVIEETEDDLDPSTEPTGWGPARRLRFPVQMDKKGPNWRHPAGPLRIDPASW